MAAVSTPAPTPFPLPSSAASVASSSTKQHQTLRKVGKWTIHPLYCPPEERKALASSDPLQSLTIRDLRAECRRFKKPVAGNKATLMGRLRGVQQDVVARHFSADLGRSQSAMAAPGLVPTCVDGHVEQSSLSVSAPQLPLSTTMGAGGHVPPQQQQLDIAHSLSDQSPNTNFPNQPGVPATEILPEHAAQLLPNSVAQPDVTSQFSDFSQFMDFEALGVTRADALKRISENFPIHASESHMTEVTPQTPLLIIAADQQGGSDEVVEEDFAVQPDTNSAAVSNSTAKEFEDEDYSAIGIPSDDDLISILYGLNKDTELLS